MLHPTIASNAMHSLLHIVIMLTFAIIGGLLLIVLLFGSQHRKESREYSNTLLKIVALLAIMALILLFFTTYLTKYSFVQTLAILIIMCAIAINMIFLPFNLFNLLKSSVMFDLLHNPNTVDSITNNVKKIRNVPISTGVVALIAVFILLIF